MKKVLIIILSLMLFTVGISGCTLKEKSAKQVILESVEKSKEINSFSFTTNVDIALDFSSLNSVSEEYAMLKMVPSLNLSIEGKETVDPMQFEGNVKGTVIFQGMNFSFDLPITLKDNILYIKIPGMLTAYMPDPAKEYLLMDMSEYSTDEQKLTNEKGYDALKNALNSLDETLFVKEETKNYTIENGKPNEVISLVIAQENLKPLLMNFKKELLPLIIEEMNKYAVTEEQKMELEQFKQDLISNQQEIDQFINDIDKYLTINNLKRTSLYDRDGFERKVLINADVLIHDETEGSIGLKLNVEENINNINEEIDFTNIIPTKEQTIDIKELEQLGNNSY